MVIVGLTGGIATGKNLISNYLEKKEIKVFDADKEVHKLFSNGNTDIYAKVVQYFPECIVQGQINRGILGRIVFQDSKKLQQLENIIYPELTKKLDEFIIENMGVDKKIIVINAPTLHKAKWDKKCNYIIFLHSDNETQEKRYFERGDAELQRFLNIKRSQEAEEKNKQSTDFLIDTTKSEHLVIKEIDTIINNVLKK